MSNYLYIPINENGIIVDDNIQNLISAATSDSFEFNDIYLYSHGWSLDATRMMDWYNRFAIEFSKANIDSAKTAPQLFQAPPSEKTLGVGIHWPSMITENENDFAQHLQQLTFYTMEKRADSVGEHGLYAVMRMVLAGEANAPLRINLLGHSFGCKVIASALEAVYQDMVAGTIVRRGDVSFNVVLLQGAFERNALDLHECYGDIENLNMRLLVTHSDKDEALQNWFDVAHLNIDFFHKANDNKRALGALGPTADTKVRMNGTAQGADIAVGPGFDGSAVARLDSRLIVADLTPIHSARGDQGNAAFSGHHSDIFLPEVYALIAGFLYNNNLKPQEPGGAKLSQVAGPHHDSRSVGVGLR